MDHKDFLLFCALVLPYGTHSQITDTTYYGKYLPNSNNGSTSVYTLKWILKVTRKKCVDECKAVDQCKYINYEVRTHLCALIRTKNNVGRDNIAAILKPGFIFGDKTQWNTTEFEECKYCPIYGECEYNPMCKHAGCVVPPLNAVTKGNMLSNGSKIRHNCTISRNNILEDATSVQSVCGEDGGWVYSPSSCLPTWNNSYYYLHTVPLTWQEAKANCEEMSGHLVVLGSEKENTFVENLIHNDTWIGGNDIDIEGEMVWMDGTNVSEGFTHWSPGNPDNDGDEDCVEIHISTYFGYPFWNDYLCSIPKHSICELAPPTGTGSDNNGLHWGGLNDET